MPLPEGPIDETLLKRLEFEFHEEHERRFTYAMRDQPIEGLHWRIAATGSRPAPEGRLEGSSAGARPTGRRSAYMASINTEVDTEIYSGDTLAEGDRIVGPAIVEFATTTVVVNPDDVLDVQADGSALLTIAL